jgi:hypothetical protein
MRLFATLALGLALLAGTARAEEAKHEEEGFGSLTVDQVSDLITRKQADIFDNNHEERYQKSHLPGAKLLSIVNIQAKDLPSDLERKLVFYCANTH